MTIKKWITAKPQPTIDPNGTVANSKADGLVSTDNLFLCHCGSVSMNTKKNIGSHLCKSHKRDSAYNRGQYMDDDRPWVCPLGCERVACPNFHSLLTHYRRYHDLRGKSSSLRTGADPHKPESTLDSQFLLSLADFKLNAIRLHAAKPAKRTKPKK